MREHHIVAHNVAVDAERADAVSQLLGKATGLADRAGEVGLDGQDLLDRVGTFFTMSRSTSGPKASCAWLSWHIGQVSSL